MNIEQSILIKSRLRSLNDRAREFGRGASIEAMQPSIAYEVCRQALSRAWAGEPIVSEIDVAAMFPREQGWGTAADDTPRIQA